MCQQKSTTEAPSMEDIKCTLIFFTVQTTVNLLMHCRQFFECFKNILIIQELVGHQSNSFRPISSILKVLLKLFCYQLQQNSHISLLNVDQVCNRYLKPIYFFTVPKVVVLKDQDVKFSTNISKILIVPNSFLILTFGVHMILHVSVCLYFSPS